MHSFLKKLCIGNSIGNINNNKNNKNNIKLVKDIDYDL